MPHYNYQGVARNGKNETGTIEAASETIARQELRTKRIRVVELKVKSGMPFSGLFGGVGLKDVSAFTRQFSSMNSAAIPLVECLGAIGEQTENKTLRAAVRKIWSDVQSGVTLAEALSRFPKIFNRLYCSMVKAGEAAGILSDVLVRLADYQEKSVAIRRKVISAFAYPAMVALVAVAAVVALMTYVVPTFSSMLAELGAKLPLVTRVVIGISEIVKAWVLPVVLIIGSGALTVFYLYQKNDRMKMALDTASLSLPLFGSLQKKSAVSRFARTFGALLKGGVPIADAMAITSSTAGNRLLEEGFLKTLESIRGGQPLAPSLKATGVFPPMVIQMIAVGEKSGNLPEMLAKISDYYDTEVDSAITTLTTILEPALIIIMGIVISGVLISMYLPMFEMVGSVG
jgi:type IV pilus assembly protein PilC